MRRLLGPRSDRGAALAMTAASMLLFMGMSALVIDIGNGWRTRRALIPATDAAALAAAQEFVKGGPGCDIAGDYLAYNHADAEWDPAADCIVSPSATADRGRVSVRATAPVQTWFASVIGSGDYDVGSFSTAAWGPPAGVTGLRPMAFCLTEELQAIIDAGAEEVIIDYKKDQPEACGDAPGNWGTINFDAGGNEFKDLVLNGYDGLVLFGNDLDPDNPSCNDEHCYPGDTGGLAGAKKEFKALVDSKEFFTVPIFDYVENPGSNALFHFVGILRVQLLDFKVIAAGNTNGNEASPSSYFQFKVEPGLVSGTCCDGGGETAGNKVIGICGVEEGSFAACDP